MDLRRQFSIAAGFLALAGLLALLAPNDPDPPGSIFETKRAVAVTDPVADPSDATAGPEPADDQPTQGTLEAPQEVRTVLPGRTPGDIDTSLPLRRVAPRSDETASVGDPTGETRGRLLLRPVAITAGRIAIGFSLVELPGVEPLGLTERCSSGSLSWPCGTRSRTELRSYLRGRSIRCDVPEGFGERRETVTSACTMGDVDIGDWVVRNGWARAAPGGPYGEAEKDARDNGRGIWR